MGRGMAGCVDGYMMGGSMDSGWVSGGGRMDRLVDYCPFLFFLKMSVFFSNKEDKECEYEWVGRI